MTKLLLNRWLYITGILLMAFACSDDEGDGGNPVASFQFETDETNFLMVHFTNFSKNADSFSWNFGDGSPASTEDDPTHTYEEAGTYTVVLSATGNGKTATKSLEVIVTDPNDALKALTGETSKSWKLIRDISTGHYPMAVGPASRSEIWWSFGGSEQLGVRPCTLNDEYIFSLDGTFEYKTNGDFWAEGMQLTGCQESIDANYVNGAGTPVPEWNSGEHEFTYNVATQKITLTGLGAFIGLPKVTTDAEVTVPQASTTYSVVKLTDGEVDTLILETSLPNPGYWRFVLVHYDNPLQEPPIPGAAPIAGFTYAVDGNSVEFTNTSTGATSYSWDFGDGSSSTAANPTHNYSTSGSFTVVLSATNGNGTTTSTQTIILGATDITLANLTGGSSKVWKLKPVAGAFRVGPSIGSGEWFSSSAADATSRTCMFDDEFIFYSDMQYDYNSKGQVFAEPYMGGTTACKDDAAVTGVYAGLTSSTTHTFEFTPAAGGDRVKIKVLGTGAFVGFSKGYNGGEYNGADVALQTSVTYDVFSYVSGGGVETLEISVPINAEKTAWWTMILVHQ